jgi:hypothetical protein
MGNKGLKGLIRRSALLFGILLLGLAAACGGDSDGGSGSGSSFGTSDLVPQRANIVGSVAVNQSLDALDMDQFFEMFSPGVSGDQDGFNKFFNVDQLKEGGIFGDVSRADIFGQFTDGDDIDYFGTVLHGSFDESELIAELEAVAGRTLVQRTYKGSNIYSPQDDPAEYDLSVLDGSIFALGTGGALNDIIDIMVGDAESASGPLIETFNGLSGGLFGLALEVPDELADESELGYLAELGDLPISLDFVSALDMVGLGGELNGDTLDLTVTMEFSDEEAAESLESFIGGIAALAGGFSTDEGAAGLLEDLKIDREGRLLTITIGIPLADIPDLFGDLTSEASTQASSSGTRPPGTPEIRPVEAGVGAVVPIGSSRDHVEEGQKIEYRTTPPSSGEHWGRWADCGWYTDGIADEVATHNLEHGNIVVSYNLPNPAQVTELREALDGERLFRDWGIARSYRGVPPGQVALTAWGTIHWMYGVNPEEIGEFFKKFAGVNGPERIPC